MTTVLGELADVRTWMGLGADTTLDAQLQLLLDGVGKAFEEHMRRPLLLTRRTEVVQRTRAFQRAVTLRYAPVTTVVSVHASAQRTWTDATLVPATGYWLAGDAGQLLFDDYELPDGHGVVRVVYDAGMAADASSFRSNYPDLHRVGLVQVQHEYQRRKTPGTTTETAQGSNKVFSGPLQLLPHVVEALAPYRRLRLS